MSKGVWEGGAYALYKNHPWSYGKGQLVEMKSVEFGNFFKFIIAGYLIKVKTLEKLGCIIQEQENGNGIAHIKCKLGQQNKQP